MSDRWKIHNFVVVYEMYPDFILVREVIDAKFEKV